MVMPVWGGARWTYRHVFFHVGGVLEVEDAITHESPTSPERYDWETERDGMVWP